MTDEDKGKAIFGGFMIGSFVCGTISLGLGFVVTESIIPSIGICLVVGVLAGLTGAAFTFKIVADQ
jgi:hypothetical protein